MDVLALNTSFGDSSSTKGTKENRLMEAVAASISIFIVCTALIINCLILGAFKRDARLQVVFNYHINNLAVADIFHCFLVMLSIASNWLHIVNHYSKYICWFLECLTAAITLREFILLHLMTRDRYQAVKRGLFYRRNQRYRSQSHYSKTASDQGSRTYPMGYGRDSFAKRVRSISTIRSGQAINAEMLGGSMVKAAGSAGALSRETVYGRRSDMSHRSMLCRIKDGGIAMTVSWILGFAIGKLIVDIASYALKGHWVKCSFHERLLYIHYSSVVHAVLLTTLLISFLLVIKERWRQKLTPSSTETVGCLGSAEKKKFHEFDEYYRSYDLPRPSCSMEPRSPVSSWVSIVPSNRWYSIQDETIKFIETDLDTYISFDNRSGNGNVSESREDDDTLPSVALTAVSVTVDKSSVMADTRIFHNKSLRTFLAKTNKTDKVALLPDNEHSSALDVEESNSRKISLGNLPINFERRYRGISGLEALANEDTEGSSMTNTIDNGQPDQQVGKSVPAPPVSLVKPSFVGQELRELDKRMDEVDTCTAVDDRYVSLHVNVPKSESESGEELRLEKGQKPQLVVNRNEKLELHRSMKIFNRIDEYYLESTSGEANTRVGENSEISKKTGFCLDLDAKEPKESKVTTSPCAASVIPMLSFSDDELTEMRLVHGNKARTDSLYTLQSCLSIPEENDSTNPDLRYTSSSSIVGDISDMSSTAPLPVARENLVGSYLGFSMDKRLSEIEGTKSAFFTIGDGIEEISEDNEIERRWQGWDNLFGYQTTCPDVENAESDRNNLTRFKDKSGLSKGPAREKIEKLTLSKMNARKEVSVTDNFQRMLDGKENPNVEATSRQYTRNTNVNKNEESGQNSIVLQPAGKLQDKTSAKSDKPAAFTSQWGVTKRSGHPVSSRDVKKFGLLGKKTVAKYKMMLENWTLQSIRKVHNQPPTPSITPKSKSHMDNWLEFYQTNCGHYRRGEVNEQPSCSISSDTREMPQNSENGAESATRFQGLPLQAGIIGHYQNNLAPAPFEVEEDADTEDGLRTSRKKTEIDVAIEQWLAFYEVTQLGAFHAQHSALRLSNSTTPLAGNFPKNMNSELDLPELQAFGDVSHRDLIKARNTWFQFYNIKTQIGASLENSSISMEEEPSSFWDLKLVHGWNGETQRHATSERFSVNSATRTVSEFTNYEYSPYSPSNAKMPMVFTDEHEKKNAEREVNYKLRHESAHSNASKNFTSTLLNKPTTFPKNSSKDDTCIEMHCSNREAFKFCPDSKIQIKSDFETNKGETQEIPGLSQKGPRSFLRTPSFNEFPLSKVTRPLAKISNSQASRVKSDPVINTSVSSVDPSNRIVKESNKHIQSRLIVAPYQHETLQNQLSACQVLARNTRSHLSPEDSFSTTSPNTVKLDPESIDIQICHPCSPTSSTLGLDPSSRKETLQYTPSTECIDPTSPGVSEDFLGASPSVSLASRLIESMSVKRRALLAELGLYHELITGLIPLDWVLPEAASNPATCDTQASGVRQGKSQATPTVDSNPDEGIECPYCLRRTQKKHANMGQQIEASFKQIFGMRGAAFLDENDKALHEEQDGNEYENETNEDSTMMCAEEKRSLRQSVRFCEDIDGEIEKADCTMPEGKDRMREFHVDLHSISSHRANDDFNTSNTNYFSGVEFEGFNSPKSSRNSQTGLKAKKLRPKFPTERGWLSWFKRGSFQSILLKDPMLALVVSYALIVLSNVLCWLPKTILYIYFDIHGFPVKYSGIEMIFDVIWYTRLVLTPCVYLYYSKGYRQNVCQMLKKPLKCMKKPRNTRGM